MNSVWVLTEEFNDYDQYGEYFRAVFSKLPSYEEIKPHLDDGWNDIGSYNDLINGVGRRNDEYNWYHLREEKC